MSTTHVLLKSTYVYTAHYMIYWVMHTYVYLYMCMCARLFKFFSCLQTGVERSLLSPKPTWLFAVVFLFSLFLFCIFFFFVANEGFFVLPKSVICRMLSMLFVCKMSSQCYVALLCPFCCCFICTSAKVVVGFLFLLDLYFSSSLFWV